MLNAAYKGDIDLSDYWNIGDERKVVFPAATVNNTEIGEMALTFILMHKGGFKLDGGTTDCQYVIGMKEAYPIKGQFSMYTDSPPSILTEIYNSMPDDFKGLFKAFQYAHYNGSTFKKNITAYLCAPKLYEIFGGNKFTNPRGGSTTLTWNGSVGNTEILQYYQIAGNNALGKYLPDGTAVRCWSRDINGTEAGSYYDGAARTIYWNDSNQAYLSAIGCI